MARPRVNDDRIQTQLRLPRPLYEALVAAANERDVSVNWLITRLLAESLPRLVPVDELLATR